MPLDTQFGPFYNPQGCWKIDERAVRATTGVHPIPLLEGLERIKPTYCRTQRVPPPLNISFDLAHLAHPSLLPIWPWPPNLLPGPAPLPSFRRTKVRPSHRVSLEVVCRLEQHEFAVWKDDKGSVADTLACDGAQGLVVDRYRTLLERGEEGPNLFGV